MNKVLLSGAVKSVRINDNATALVEIEYGPSRNPTGGRFEFVNEATVRIPAPLLLRLTGVPLTVGAWVEITARLQGKLETHTGHKSLELVAEHVSLVGDVAELELAA